MKKILITTLLAGTALTLVSAQETNLQQPKTGVKPQMMKGEMRGEGMKGEMMKGSATQGMPPKGMPMMEGEKITTGDAALDAQIEALRTELKAKVKAIQDEYETKMKTLLKDKKPMMASTTKMMRKGDDDKMDGKMMNGTNTMMKRGERGDRPENGTGTPMNKREGMEGRPMGTGTRPLPPKMENKPKGPVSFIQDYFGSFFGGAKAEAESDSR